MYLSIICCIPPCRIIWYCHWLGNLAENNGSLLSGLWLTSPASWLPRDWPPTSGLCLWIRDYPTIMWYDMQLWCCAARMRLLVATWNIMVTWRRFWWTCVTSCQCAIASCTSVSSCWVHRRWPSRWSGSIICYTLSSAVSVTWSTVC